MKQRGFIALISAVVIAAILMSLAAAGNLSGFYARSNALVFLLKAQSRFSAESCISLMKLQLVTDATYTATLSRALSVDDTCVALVSQIATTTQKQIEIYATSSKQSTSHFSTIVDVVTLSPLSQTEIFR